MAVDEVTVLGAGIGGLACALALARRGIRVRLIEQSQAFGEVGAGLQLSPNGMAVLRGLGLEDQITACTAVNRAVVLRDGPTGRDVFRMPLNDSGFRFIHRADLIACLAKGARAAGVAVAFGLRVVRIETGPEGCTLHHEDGGRDHAAVLVGADGVRSVLRGRINPDTGAPFFTGQVAWRALIPAAREMPDEATVFLGPGRHLVRYPLPSRGVVNLVGVEERAAWAEESWSAQDDPANFRHAFRDFRSDIARDLAAVDRVNLWGLFRHGVAPRWHDSHAALLGDAAHPTLPFLAQGANLALEDAWVLADCLDRLPRNDALAAYQARRRSRVVRAIAAANDNARNYHLSGRFERGAAHTALRLLGATAPGLMLRRFDWLYRHDVTAA